MQVDDFFDAGSPVRFSAAVGNPTYICFQDFSGEDRAKARTAAMQHGVRTMYRHALPGSITVSVVDVVQAGQQIAAVGNTGTSTGPHLHLEVRDIATGGATDPQTWLDGHGVGL
ncbi:hypothetical protein C5E07_11320 [Pseudoclavibacter sp. RFBJ3]|uniref:M23 family metallopeptidase n=1 Tax=unclassified Pseudoclavibacter TaxID=2615177 RepID=UPI000CE758E0|nr:MULTISPECIES: M23 family metallopeptidase [unclassified Pseudoclavibacter]PPF83279.1 hypothetical protein C5C12_10395 [Pseudoclavibacter sp. RFBJ5]PPF91821.1 hypothetical protein C5E07_11320 [Pseudoclavibacter sp. RFBJ3]PPG01131.1 hypothetical protein C5C19_00635 [Pseudoclavibacter sp. RFBH5]PPG26234.1 hypothetical protein C5E13_00590 [Pseudoclavibacter sp. RFBI4]